MESKRTQNSIFPNMGLTRGPKLDLSSGFSPEAFPINGYAARQRMFDNGVPSPSPKQWNYLTRRCMGTRFADTRAYVAQGWEPPRGGRW
jgi:hypothetical protein